MGCDQQLASSFGSSGGESFPNNQTGGDRRTKIIGGLTAKVKLIELFESNSPTKAVRINMAQLESQRHLFDIPPEVAYFNCAYNSPLLIEAGKALVEGAMSNCRPWQRKPADFFDDAEKFRKLASRALGGNSECYAVIPSASYGTSTVARIFEEKLGRGDEIIVLEKAFPSEYLPWQRLSQATDAKLVVVKAPTDFNWTQAVLDCLTTQTKLVAIPNCHWTNGAQLNLLAISEATHALGACLSLELTQSLGALPLDMDRVSPDFVIAAGYKWLLFPYGLSLFYVDPRWHRERPLEETWLSREGAQVFEKLTNYVASYQSGARRFEMGQKSIPSLLPGGLVALRQLGDWGVSNIADSLEVINDCIAQVLEETGWAPVPKQYRSPHLLGAFSEGDVPKEFVERLAGQNVFVSYRENSLRITPHLHVNGHDLSQLFRVLEREGRQ